MTSELLTAVTNNDEIRKGLFPPPSAEPNRKNGGKYKTDFQYQAAEALFKDNPEYSAAFNNATTAAQKAVWTTKIKNKIAKYVPCLVTRADADTFQSMIMACKKYRKQMGQTGEGITREEEIDMELENEFTTKWGEFEIYGKLDVINGNNKSARTYKEDVPLVLGDVCSYRRASQRNSCGPGKQPVRLRHIPPHAK